MNRSEQISEELRREAPGLIPVGRHAPYWVPDGYFVSFPEAVMRLIRAYEAASSVEELRELSPLLSSLSKKMPYKAPQGYFESLAPAMSADTMKPAAPVRRMTSIFRYAAAAVITGLIAVSAWLFWNQSDAGTAETTMADNSTTQPTVLEKIEAVPDAELEGFLEGALGTISYEDIVVPEGVIQDDVRLLFSEVSEAELEGYLN